MSNLSNRGKIVKKGANVRVPIIARGPVIRPIVDALHNPNLRDPEEDQRSSQRSSHNGQSTGQKKVVVPQYQLVPEPMLPSVSYSVLILMGCVDISSYYRTSIS